MGPLRHYTSFSTPGRPASAQGRASIRNVTRQISVVLMQVIVDGASRLSGEHPAMSNDEPMRSKGSEPMIAYWSRERDCPSQLTPNARDATSRAGRSDVLGAADRAPHDP